MSAALANLSTLDAKSNPAVNSLRKEDAKKSDADTSGKKLSQNFDEFMLLLTTQLQNQDPTEPLDTNQFTQQLVAFSGVEQSVATNKNLEKLIGLTSNTQLNGAVGYIGKSVDLEGTQLSLKNGQGSFGVDVPAGTASVTVGVLDKAGKPLYSQQVNKVPAGRQTFFWDGTNSFGGPKAVDGVYSFGVVAKDAKGNVLQSKTYTTGTVAAVALDGDKMMLTLDGGLQVPIDQVSAVRDAPKTVQPVGTENATKTTTTPTTTTNKTSS